MQGYRKWIIWAGIVIGVMMGAWWFFRASVAPVDIDTSVQIRNISWNTPISEATPFRKGDRIDLVYFMRNIQAYPQVLQYDFSFLQSSFDIESILVDNDKKQTVMTGLKWEYILDGNIESAIHLTGIVKESEKLQAYTQTSAPNTLGFVRLTPVSQWELPPISKESVGDSTMDIKKGIEAEGYNPNIDNVFVVEKPKNATVNSVMIGDTAIEPIAVWENILVHIPAKKFQEGRNFVALSLSDGTLMPLNTSLNFNTKLSPISISHIFPSEISGEKARYITIQWSGLWEVISIQLSNNVVIQKTDYVRISNEVIWVKIPEGLTTWRYHFNLMDSSGIYEFPEQILQIR